MTSNKRLNMRGNQIGKLFSVTSFGESHGPALGAIIDGVPGGLKFDLLTLENELQRRAPGQHLAHTSRKEDDKPEVLSGIFENKTLGTPICVIVKNTNQRSSDYDKDLKRPGHADQTTLSKYHHRDYRGGGRASGRETIARVIGGYFASLIIPDVQTKALISHLGPYVFNPSSTNSPSPLHLKDPSFNQEIENFLVESKKKGESWGGIIELKITHVPKNLGEPCFDKLKADLAKGMMSIGATLGISFGGGFEAALFSGSKISSDPDYFGGMEGGISNGDDLLMNIAFKAPSTIGEKALSGRHDPCILPRAVPVVESMAKIILADHFLRQKAYE